MHRQFGYIHFTSFLEKEGNEQPRAQGLKIGLHWDAINLEEGWYYVLNPEFSREKGQIERDGLMLSQVRL